MTNVSIEQSIANIESALLEYKRTIQLAGLTVFSQDFTDLTKACDNVHEFLDLSTDELEDHVDRFYDILKLVTSANELSIAKAKYADIITAFDEYSGCIMLKLDQEASESGEPVEKVAAETTTADENIDEEPSESDEKIVEETVEETNEIIESGDEIVEETIESDEKIVDESPVQSDKKSRKKKR